MALLETKRLTKSFGGVHAVDSVDISLEAGKITALIGPNGSGKTTLIHVVTGMLPIDGGSVHVAGADRTRLRPFDVAAFGVARTFQSVRLIEQISVYDNVLLALTARSVWAALVERVGAGQRQEAERILKTVGLWEKRSAHAGTLSYGQRKLLEIGRAVAMNGRVYFFDEPFAGLFKEMRIQVANILLALKKDGTAIALVEHDIELIRTLADHCYVLDAGKVIAEGAPDEVLRNRAVIDAYLGK
jgi:ABC-type branched-subunit amino acid transport system ATPase component